MSPRNLGRLMSAIQARGVEIPGSRIMALSDYPARWSEILKLELRKLSDDPKIAALLADEAGPEIPSGYATPATRLSVMLAFWCAGRLTVTADHPASINGRPVIVGEDGELLDYQSGVRAIRDHLGLDNAALAQACDVSPRTVEGWLHGRIPTAAALNVMGDLLRRQPSA